MSRDGGAVDLDAVLNKGLKHFIKSFAWYAAALSVIIIVFLTLGFMLDVDVTTRGFVIYSLIVTICGVLVYFSFIQDGREAGKGSEPYKTNLDAYQLARDGRTRAEVARFLRHARESEKQEYIDEVAALIGIDAAVIPTINLKNRALRREYSRKERWHIRRIQMHKYPYTYPKTAADVLNVMPMGKLGSHGLDPAAAKNYLRQKAAGKLITTALFSGVSGAIVVQFGQINAIEAVIKIALSVMGIGISIVMGYINGRKSTAVLEKDILGSMVRLMREMDVWAKTPAAE